jgi:hypothetical protein
VVAPDDEPELDPDEEPEEDPDEEPDEDPEDDPDEEPDEEPEEDPDEEPDEDPEDDPPEPDPLDPGPLPFPGSPVLLSPHAPSARKEKAKGSAARKIPRFTKAEPPWDRVTTRRKRARENASLAPSPPTPG